MFLKVSRYSENTSSEPHNRFSNIEINKIIVFKCVILMNNLLKY